jgi:hypothetical protein
MIIRDKNFSLFFELFVALRINQGLSPNAVISLLTNL